MQPGGKPPGPLFVLRGHRADVQAVAWHPSSAQLFTGDAGGVVQAWDLQQQRPYQTLRAHEDSGGILSLHVVGLPGAAPLLVSQGREGHISVWALDDQGRVASEPLQTLFCETYSFCRAAVHVCAASACSPTEAAGGAGGAPAAGSAAGQPCSPAQRSAEHHAEAAQPATPPASAGVAQAPAQPQLAERGDTAGRALLGSLDSSAERAQPAECAQQADVPHAASPAAGRRDGTATLPATIILATAGSDPATLDLYDLLAGRRLRQLSQAGDEPKRGMCMAMQLFTCAAMGAGRLLAAVGHEDGTLAVWDTGQPGSRPAVLLMAGRLHQEAIMCLAIDSSGQGGVTGSPEDKITVFKLDLASQQVCAAGSLALGKEPGAGDVVIRQDARLVVAGGWDGKLRIFHYRRHKPLAVLQYHRAAVTAVQFDAEGRRFVSAGRDGTVAVWSVYADI